MYYETISWIGFALVMVALFGCLTSHWIGCWLDRHVITDENEFNPGCFKSNERLP
jgi:membrane protein DedA with SNARE-associated domain